MENAFDIAVLVIVSLSTLIAVLRGFLREVLSLLGWAVAATVAYMFYPLAAEMLADKISNEMTAKAVGAIGLFIVTLIGWSIISFLALRLVKLADIGPIDRSLGFAFGLVRGLLIVSVAYLGLSLFFDENTMPEWVESAKTRRLAEIGAGMVEEAAPDMIETSRKAIGKAMEAQPQTPAASNPSAVSGSYALGSRPADHITDTLKRTEFQQHLSVKQMDTLSSMIDAIPENLGIDTNPDLSRFSDKQVADYYLRLLEVYRDLKTQNQVPLPEHGDASESGLKALEKSLTSIQAGGTPAK